MMRAMSTRAALLVIAACGSTNHAPVPAATPSGPQPVVSLAIWPERWPAIAALPQVKTAGLEIPTSFWEFAQTAATLIHLKVALPPPGLDTSQPITAEVGAPRGTFEAIAVAAAKKDMNALKNSFAMRVRVTFPARDAGALASAFESAIAARRKDDRPSLRVVRGDHAVAVDMSFDVAEMQDAGPPPAIAVAFDAGHDSAARAALRLPGLADLGAMTAMLKMMGALADIEPEHTKEILANGTAEVLTGYLMIDPATSVSNALLIDVPATGNPQVGFELTEAGKAALAAGGLAPGKRSALDAVKWQAVIDAVPRAALLANVKDPMRDVATLFHECGSFCFAYVAMGNALDLASAFGDADLGKILKEKGGGLGMQLGDISVTGNLAFIMPAGAKEPAWNVPAAPAAQSAAEACYRKALLDVRAALRNSELDRADAALAGATSCVAADPAIAARHHDLREFVLTLRGS
jgi:hypothetical protein